MFFTFEILNKLFWAAWSSGGVGISVVVVFIVIVVVVADLVLKKEEGCKRQKVSNGKQKMNMTWEEGSYRSFVCRRGKKGMTLSMQKSDDKGKKEQKWRTGRKKALEPNRGLKSRVCINAPSFNLEKRPS
jgi:predicted Holliday junction resolvase-like endonuclease